MINSCWVFRFLLIVFTNNFTDRLETTAFLCLSSEWFWSFLTENNWRCGTPGHLIASQTLQLMVTSVRHVDGPVHIVWHWILCGCSRGRYVLCFFLCSFWRRAQSGIGSDPHNYFDLTSFFTRNETYHLSRCFHDTPVPTSAKHCSPWKQRFQVTNLPSFGSGLTDWVKVPFVPHTTRTTVVVPAIFQHC